MKQTAAQTEALKWVAQVNSSDEVTVPTPRADVLRRLAEAGLIEHHVTTYRPRTCDRWRFRHYYTMIGA